MAKKMKRRLADDLLESLNEAHDYFAGKKTGAVVHRVTPSQSDAREARHKLGLSQREFASLVVPRMARPWAPSASRRLLWATVRAASRDPSAWKAVETGGHRPEISKDKSYILHGRWNAAKHSPAPPRGQSQGRLLRLAGSG